MLIIYYRLIFSDLFRLFLKSHGYLLSEFFYIWLHLVYSSLALLSDETRIQYIQEAVQSAFATYGKRKKPTGGMNRGGRTSPDGSPEPLVAAGGTTSAGGGDQYQQEDYDASYNVCFISLLQSYVQIFSFFINYFLIILCSTHRVGIILVLPCPVFVIPSQSKVSCT